MILSKRSLLLAFLVFLVLHIAFSNYTLASEASSQSLDLYPNISHIDNDNSGTITIGDELKIGTESFYVLSYSNNTIRALSKYNLDVGFDCTNSVKVEKANPTGLQNLAVVLILEQVMVQFRILTGILLMKIVL